MNMELRLTLLVLPLYFLLLILAALRLTSTGIEIVAEWTRLRAEGAMDRVLDFQIEIEERP